MKAVISKSNYKERRTSQAVKISLIALFIGFSSPFISAEELAVSVAQQGNQTVQTPRNGQKMENVEAQYGEPIERVSPVGEPPISKWVYSDFTVYFEHELVLHAVVHRS